jgi:signal transduction histidine kinase
LSLLSLAVLVAHVLTAALFPFVARKARMVTNLRRDLARRWTGISIARPYVGTSVLRDRATWRDILFLALDPVAGLALVAVPALLMIYACWGLLTVIPLRLLSHGEDWGGGWYGQFAGSELLAVPAAVVLAWLAVRVAPACARANSRWVRVLLAPGKKSQLALRVQELTEARSDATGAQASELRRIERDLHDGAQARLVAMGLGLGALERLIDRDPDAAKAILAEVRDNSAKALVELRSLVRGIHPPVLAERGLADAVRALALDTPLPVRVSVDLPNRLDPPVESAAYFAISEAITNVTAHAGATGADVGIRLDNGVLELTVRDDGRGGAESARGSGLRGIERRLSAFDGTLALDSPPGGPTTLRMTIHVSAG